MSASCTSIKDQTKQKFSVHIVAQKRVQKYIYIQSIGEIYTQTSKIKKIKESSRDGFNYTHLY
jgi:hypothetical protein